MLKPLRTTEVNPRIFPWRSTVIVLVIFLFGLFSGKLPRAAIVVGETTLLAFLIHAIEKEFFWKSLLRMVQLALENVHEKQNALLRNSSKAGITAIYVSRSGATPAVLDAIAASNKRVWLLGIALHEVLSVAEVLPALEAKRLGNKDFDLKILVLDPLRSPALFRVFLESKPAAIRSILDYRRPGSSDLDPLFNQTLHHKVRDVFHLFHDPAESALANDVRFYAHDPICWLVIADDIAFHEPYTFGDPQGDSSHRCIGPIMPTFRIERTRDSVAFETLEDHFCKLWITSDIDVFHFESRLADAQSIAAKIFKQRGDWFERVYRALDSWDKRKQEHPRDRRICPRLPCETDPRPNTKLTWNIGMAPHESACAIKDFSRSGLCVSLPKDSHISQNTEVRLRGEHGLVTEHFGKSPLIVRWSTRTEQEMIIGIGMGEGEFKEAERAYGRAQS
jgi:hypothetical protein